MYNQEIEIVINKDFGGFSYDKEIADWLAQNHNWKVITCAKLQPIKIQNWGNSATSNQEHDLTTIIDIGNGLYFPYKDTIELRTHLHLIECVKTLKTIPKTGRDRKVDDLKVQKIKIEIEIDSYDGKETAKVYSLPY